MLKRTAFLLLLGACGSVSDKSPDAAIDIDSAGSDAAPDAPAGLKPWGAPVKIDEINSAQENSGDASMTADMLTIVFKRSNELYSTHRTTPSGTFAAPALITELNSTADDAHPFILADGLRIYFSSTRTGGLGSYDIYTSVRATPTSTWGAPVIVNDLSSATSDLEVALAANNTVGILMSDRGGMRAPYAISRATPTGLFSSIVQIGTGTDCVDSTIANGGLSAYCSHGTSIDMATRPDLASSFGAFTSVFTTPIGGTTVGDPWVSDDQNTMLVTIDTGTIASIYVVKREP